MNEKKIEKEENGNIKNIISFILALLSVIVLINLIGVSLFQENGIAQFLVVSLYSIPFCFICSIISIILSYGLLKKLKIAKFLVVIGFTEITILVVLTCIWIYLSINGTISFINNIQGLY